MELSRVSKGTARLDVADAPSEDGAIGGKAQQVGGPFDKDGAVGKQFTEQGAVGGTAQNAAETAQGDQPSAFDAKGMVGKHFTGRLPASLIA